MNGSIHAGAQIPRRRAAVAIAAAIGVLTACGSTVQQRSPRLPDSVAAANPGSAVTSTNSALGDGLGAVSTDPAEDAAHPGSASNQPLTADQASSSGSGPGADQPAAVGGADKPPDAPAQGTVQNGPGVTPSAISVGFAFEPGADEYQKALGNTSATQGDPKAVVTAVAADINSRGGVGGRRLNVVYHEADAQSAETKAQRAQALCEAFTSDAKVFAVAGATSELLRACLLKAGVVNVIGGALVDTIGDGAAMDSADYRASPHFYDVHALLLDQVGKRLVDQLVAQRYFTGWDAAQGAPSGAAAVKTGLVYPDKPGWDRVVERIILPGLKAAGHAVAPENVKRWHFPESTTDNGQAVSEIQSAVLRFRSDGVTHVLPLEQNSLVFFSQGAEGQGYRPRYGISSHTLPQALAGELVPYRQLRGATGLGWSPSIDLPESQVKDAGPYAGPGRGRCLSLLRKASISFANATERTVALVLCDIFFSLEAAVERVPAGSGVNVNSFMQALQRTGSSFPIAGLPRGGFGQGGRFPVTHGYHYSFDEACRCMKYTGQAFPLR